jgi:hypothetical protein
MDERKIISGLKDDLYSKLYEYCSSEYERQITRNSRSIKPIILLFASKFIDFEK